MDYKKAFFSALEESYLGSKVKNQKDKSGFANLLDIKSQYYQAFKDELEKKIQENGGSDLYNKLYTFFESYLNQTGVPFFNDTPIYKNIYARVYNNSKDTALFYKTQDLYYVKSDTLYQSLEIQDKNEKYTFSFTIDENNIQNTDNTKNQIKFYLVKIEDSKIYIQVTYDKTSIYQSIFKEGEKEFKEEFIKEIKENKIDLEEENLKEVFRDYKKQNEIDFFIHKNARSFLQEQFDLWMFNHLYRDSQIHQWELSSIQELQKLRNIAFEIIEKIARFEDELKAIWLKPKFAKNTQYVFSLDLIYSHAKEPQKLLENFIKDEKFQGQIQEWKELELIDEDFSSSELLKGEIFTEEKYLYLPLDTKHLNHQNRYALLNSFDDLESLLNGELIKSDNFQALNTLMSKYQGKVDLIYIDPPFNTGSDFEYKDKFQDSTWLTLMKNRLELSKDFLSDKGSFWLHLDENADFLGKILLNEIFNMECKKITFDTNATKDEESDLFGYKSFGQNFVLKSSTLLFLKTQKSYFNKLWKPNRNTSTLNIGQLDLISIPKKDNAKKIEDFNFYIEEYINNELRMVEKEINEKIYPIGDIWNDIYSFTQSEMRVSENISFFSSQKPENMMRRIIQTSSLQKSYVLDFFSGSGTTLGVAHKIKRKYIGIEMGEHFFETYKTINSQTNKMEKRLGLLGRMKNIIAGDQNFYAVGKKRRSSLSGKINFRGGGAFRYYELESYEEALRGCEYVLDNEGVIDYRKSRKLIKSLNKGEKVCLDMQEPSRKDYDIFQTMANIMGWSIKRIFLDKENIPTCEFSNGEIINLQELDLVKYPKLKNLIWWR